MSSTEEAGSSSEILEWGFLSITFSLKQKNEPNDSRDSMNLIKTKFVSALKLTTSQKTSREEDMMHESDATPQMELL